MLVGVGWCGVEVLGITAIPHGKREVLRKVLKRKERMGLLKEVDEKKVQTCEITEDYDVSGANMSLIVKDKDD